MDAQRRCLWDVTVTGCPRISSPIIIVHSPWTSPATYEESANRTECGGRWTASAFTRGIARTLLALSRGAPAHSIEVMAARVESLTAHGHINGLGQVRTA